MEEPSHFSAAWARIALDARDVLQVVPKHRVVFRQRRDHEVAARAVGNRLAQRFIHRCTQEPVRRPDLWFTYHLYYKAPDWLGPRVAEALSIPYVVAEASVAGTR